MNFTWDANKNRTNLIKHGVSFELAVQVFEDSLHVSVFDRVVDCEERWHAIGSTRDAVILLVVHTFRDQSGQECIRIISARKATLRERRHYERSTDTNFG